MFDKYIVPTKTEFVTKDVHIHRAPTDESVKLLHEMEQKAQDKIEKTVRLESNTLNAVLHQMTDPLNLDSVYVIQLDLNGNRHRCVIRIDSLKNKEERIKYIVQELSNQIACEVLKGVSDELVGVL